MFLNFASILSEHPRCWNCRAIKRFVLLVEIFVFKSNNGQRLIYHCFATLPHSMYVPISIEISSYHTFIQWLLRLSEPSLLLISRVQLVSKSTPKKMWNSSINLFFSANICCVHRLPNTHSTHKAILQLLKQVNP